MFLNAFIIIWNKNNIAIDVTSIKGAFAKITGGPGYGVPEVEKIPRGTGAYLLLLALDTEIERKAGGLGPIRLPAGLYAYAGSAWGPGGLRARIARHARRGKKTHWHIDPIRESASSFCAYPQIGGNECDLIEAVLTMTGAEIQCLNRSSLTNPCI